MFLDNQMEDRQEEVKIVVDFYPCHLVFSLVDVKISRNKLSGYLPIVDMTDDDVNFIFPTSKIFNLQIETSTTAFQKEEDVAFVKGLLLEKTFMQNGKGWELGFSLGN